MHFDWPKLYASVLGRPVQEKLAQGAARLIEHDIRAEKRRAGEVLGGSDEIARRYGLARETLLGAVRLLEDQGIARMRRGPGGGLMVLEESHATLTRFLAEYFLIRGITSVQRKEAEHAVALLSQAAGTGPSDSEDYSSGYSYALLTRGLDYKSPAAEPNGVSKISRVLRPFVDALEILEQWEDPPRPSALNEGSLAILVARLLADEVRRLRERGEERLGSEAKLTERIGVSRQVLRQAVQMLETRGVLICRRGRSRGVEIRLEHARDAIERITEHYTRLDVGAAEFRPILSLIGRLNRHVMGMRTEPGDFTGLRRMIAEQDWTDANGHVRRIHMEWRMIDNPVLSLIEQSLAAYRARRAGKVAMHGAYDIGRLKAWTDEHLENLAVGDLAAADRVYCEMHSYVDRVLGRY